MNADFNLLITLGFIATSAFTSLLFPRGSKWIALLLCSVATYAFLFGWQVLWLLAMASFAYAGAFRLAGSPQLNRLLIPCLLTPLLLEKSTHLTPHFWLNTAPTAQSSAWWQMGNIIGLSYFTFNSISYLTDVKRKYIEPETSWLRLLFYLLFFPALLSGPLQRFRHMQQQLSAVGPGLSQGGSGFLLLLWGLFKNMVVAQRLQYLLRGMDTTGWWVLAEGLVFFLFLYTNFSSFMDMVQGIGLLFNLQVKSNFHNRVYMAASRQQFWKGWHITLNEWFRDYYFFALSSYDKKRRYTQWLLLSTFVLIALWHGFSWVLLLWGLLNGCWIIAEKKWLGQWSPSRWWQLLAGRLYHLALASALATLFIAPSLSHLAQQFQAGSSRLTAKFLQGNGRFLIVLALAFGVMDLINARAGNKRMDLYFLSLPYWQRTLLTGALLLTIFLFGLTNSIANYYMRF